MKKRFFVVASLSALTLFLAPDRAAACPTPGAGGEPPPALPSLDCTVTPNCCTGTAIDVDNASLFATTFACLDSLLWAYVGPQCDANVMTSHTELFTKAAS